MQKSIKSISHVLNGNPPKGLPKRSKRLVGKARHLKEKYNLTTRDYKTMMRGQKHQCAGCRSTFSGKCRSSTAPNVDHCHVTGEVRALLCGNCNKALGMVKDNPITLDNLAAYLRLVKEPI